MAFKLPFGPLAFGFELLFLVLFAIFADYDDAASGSYALNSDRRANGTDPNNNPLTNFYPMFQDVHVMMFIGFGFLMTFLKRYSFSAVGFNMLITCFVIQWALILNGLFTFIHHPHARFTINIESLIMADFAAAAVLISFGAVLGKISPQQLVIMAFIEVCAFKANEFIGLDLLQVTDVGGSMFVHAFGAYFGMAVARVIYTNAKEDSNMEESIYHSDLFAMIGTIFLWMYWPSFNAALAPGDRQHRAVINTYMSLAACCVTTFAMQRMICSHKKFDMVHVQNATLAGGVAVGTAADLMLYPAGAVSVGIVAGTLSSLGYEYLTPFLTSKLKIHDTCGVNNLHGMPGIMAGLVGIIMAAVASESQYNFSLYEVFPARAPANGTKLLSIQSLIPDVEAGAGRTAGGQAGYQAAALAMTLTVAVVSGLLTGLVLRLGFWEAPSDEDLYTDRPWWHTPDDFKDERVLAFANQMRSGSVDGNGVHNPGHRDSTINLVSVKKVPVVSGTTNNVCPLANGQRF